MPRAALQAHTQLCRACGTLRPRSEFRTGDAFCMVCRVACGGRIGARDAADPIPFVVSAPRAKHPAIKAHEAELDRVLASLLFDGGMFSVQVAVAEGVKRLAMKHRDQLSTEGWVI